MRRRTESVQRGDPHFFPDGRRKTSPDDTSLLGLSAVWSELDEPLPPKGVAAAGRRHAGGGSHGRRAARRRARRAERTIPRGVMIGVGGALFLVLLSSWILISIFIP
ncbi:MAG TPA: hypothetical protein VFZ37_16370 [Jiangellaceae bacterium]